MIKSRRIRWEGITATCERLKMHTLFWIRNLQVRGPLGRPRCEWRITLITRSKLWCRTLGPSGSSHGPVTGILQYGNEPPPSIKKSVVFHGQFGICLVLETDSTPWSFLLCVKFPYTSYISHFHVLVTFLMSLYILHISFDGPCYISRSPMRATFSFFHTCHFSHFPI